MSVHIAITGANGFMGRRLSDRLLREGYDISRITRSGDCGGDVVVGEIEGDTDWKALFKRRVDVLVHLAASVHRKEPWRSETEDLDQKVNTEGTLNLARKCAANGVKRFVFLSTVKVLGEGLDRPYRTSDGANPKDSYAASKWEAEKGLFSIAARTGMEVVIVRPPLVYGPGVKANFLRLIQAVDRGHPLPLGSIRNRRSLIYLDNLIDAVRVCLTHPSAAGKTYLVSDGEDVSTPELVRRVGAALHKPVRLLPVPASWIFLFGKISGKKAAVNRLLGSLSVDSHLIRRELGWAPPFTMQQGLAATAEWYQNIKAQNAARI